MRCPQTVNPAWHSSLAIVYCRWCMTAVWRSAILISGELGKPVVQNRAANRRWSGSAARRHAHPQVWCAALSQVWGVRGGCGGLKPDAFNSMRCGQGQLAVGSLLIAPHGTRLQRKRKGAALARHALSPEAAAVSRDELAA